MVELLVRMIEKNLIDLEYVKINHQEYLSEVNMKINGGE